MLRPSPLLLTFVSVTAVSLTSLVLVYALLYTVTPSDTVDISATASPRQTVEDTIDFDADTAKSAPASPDVLGTSETALSHSFTIDSFDLSDSAQAASGTFHQVDVTSALLISETSASGASVNDTIDFGEIQSLQNPISDAISLLDSVGRVFLVELFESLSISDASETEQVVGSDGDDEDQNVDRAENRGRTSDRVVFDTTHFRKNPLDRIQVRSFYLLNSQENAIEQARLGDTVDIAATIRNYQSSPQPYIFIVQIVDGNNYTVEIIMVSGIVDGAEAADLTPSWTPSAPGDYSLKIMIWDDISSLSSTPTPLSDIAIKELRVS